MSEHEAAPAGRRPGDSLPFGDPADEEQPQGTIPLDSDQDGVLNPHEDLGQAGKEPDVGPAIGPSADA